jgi:MFS family permease
VIPGATARADLTRTRRGVTATFAYAGALAAVWTVRLPALTDELHLDPGDVGAAVLLFGLGATAAMQATRVLLPRLGSRWMLTVSGPAAAAGTAAMGLAPNLAALLVVMLWYGAAFGSLDVSMNAQAAAVERALRRHIMNGAHAGWSVGAVGGGIGGAVAAYFGIGFTATVVGAGVIALPLALALSVTYLPDRPAPRGRAPRPKLPRVVYLIGAVTCASFMIEGAVADWSGLYVYRELDGSQVVAAAAYPTLEAAMIVGRTFGDRVRAAVGTRPMLVAAGVGIAAGMGLALIATGWALALAGFFVIGLSVSTVVPITFSLAGALDDSGAGIAQAGALGYAGGVLGPVLIGPLADATSLRTGLFVIVALGVVVSAIGGFLPQRVTADLGT